MAGQRAELGIRRGAVRPDRVARKRTLQAGAGEVGIEPDAECAREPVHARAVEQLLVMQEQPVAVADEPVEHVPIGGLLDVERPANVDREVSVPDLLGDARRGRVRVAEHAHTERAVEQGSPGVERVGEARVL